MYKLTVYIPQSADEQVLSQIKTAIFNAGAGNIGNYAHCCWQTLGVGEFKPLVNSTPFIGDVDEVSQVPEWRLECVLADDCVKAVITALKQAHPYETPAYDVIKLVDI